MKRVPIPRRKHAYISTESQLKKRGYIGEDGPSKFENLSKDTILGLLKSKNAFERTAAVRILARDLAENLIKLYIDSLVNEKALYTKIELCEAIAKYGDAAIPCLVPYLGRIGRNQHKIAKIVDINKKSFPLPRDIVARILIRLGPSVLPYMEDVLINGEYSQKLEAIDVIGHVSQNNCDSGVEKIMLSFYETHKKDPLIKWKCIRSFQSFNSSKVMNLLKGLIKEEKNTVFRKEAERSINRINKRILRHCT